MSEEVVKWIAEIRNLKQQLAQAQSDRDQASNSAANWRNLYTNEAQQRRDEATSYQEKIEQLQAEMQQLKSGGLASKASNPEAKAAIAAEIEQLQTKEELQERLIAVIQERDQALAALQNEQTEHSKTRKSLTSLLGETIDKLAKQ